MRAFPLEHKKLMFMFMIMLMLMILMSLVGTKLKKAAFLCKKAVFLQKTFLYQSCFSCKKADFCKSCLICDIVLIYTHINRQLLGFY